MPTQICYGSVVGPMDRPAILLRRTFAETHKSTMTAFQDRLLNGTDLFTRILTCTRKCKKWTQKIRLLGPLLTCRHVHCFQLLLELFFNTKVKVFYTFYKQGILDHLPEIELPIDQNTSFISCHYLLTPS